MCNRLLQQQSRRMPSWCSYASLCAATAQQVQRQQHQPLSTLLPAATQPAPPKLDWNRTVSEAKRIVDYPTASFSLHWLLSDEVANVAVHLRRLLATNHPLLNTAKQLLYHGQDTMLAWGLIVLLISKAAGQATSVSDVEQDQSAGVLHSQRVLAEITEMIRLSQLVHNSLINLQPSSEAGRAAASCEETKFGNKVSVIIGDALLSCVSLKLANLRNYELHALISSTVRDFSMSQFVGERDEQNNPLPSKPGSAKVAASNGNGTVTTESIDFDENDVMIPLDISSAMGVPEKEWESRNVLSVCSLLAKSCQGALKLAGQSDELQRQAYHFGRHLSLVWQACLDAEPFRSSTLPLDATFSLVSAPILFHLEYDASLYDEIEKGQVSVEYVDYAKIHRAILAGPGLEKTKQLQRKHTNAAISVLEQFPANDARNALENIVLAMQNMSVSAMPWPTKTHIYDRKQTQKNT